MAQQTRIVDNEQQRSPVVVVAERPYPPSWLNRFIDWIERQPGPVWPYYLGAFLLVAVLAAVASWLTGEAPLWSIDAQPFLNAIYPTYFVAFMHYLDGEARSALAKFRPALQVSDAEYARLQYELTTVPAPGAWIAAVLAIVPGFLDAISGDEDAFSHPGGVAGITIIALLTAFSMATLLILIYHTIRQLRMVSRIHAEAATINLFQAWPAYAFSQLTARTGIGLIFFTYFDMVQNPDNITEPVSLGFFVLAFLVAGAAFVLPLFGMHQRLVLEKNRLQSEINNGMEVTHRKLQERVHTEDFSSVEDLDKVLASLLSLREVVAKLSTWPWQPETLRGFISALFVPILLWAITQVLERFIVF